MSNLRTIPPPSKILTAHDKRVAWYDATIFTQIHVPRSIIGNIWRNYEFLQLWERMMRFYDYRCAGCEAKRDLIKVHPDIVVWSPFPNTLVCPARLQPLCSNCIRTLGAIKETDFGKVRMGRMKGIDQRPGGWKPIADWLGHKTAFAPLATWRVMSNIAKKNYVSPNTPQEPPPFIFE
jgi:hypothetical protein